MDRAQADPARTASELEGAPVPGLTATDREGHGDSDVEVDKYNLGNGYRPHVVVAMGCLA